jgi:Uma2 family endonuclease
MAIGLPWGVPLTADDLDELPADGHRYELVDGSLLVTPAPNIGHQKCIGALFSVLRAARPPGFTVLFAPFDFRPSMTTLLQPDLLVAPDTDFTPKRIEVAPLLVVEVGSPSTRRIDQGTKRLAYEAAGVAAYWLLDPDEPALTVLHLEGGTYVEHARVAGDEPYVATVPYPVTIVPGSLLAG